VARLPIVGADNAEWGEVLNEYLRVNHGVDGALNSSTLAGLPPAGTAGRLVRVTDATADQGLVIDTGLAWELIGPTNFTTGSIHFAGSNGAVAQDSANFFWDDANNRLGIGTSSPVSLFDINPASFSGATFVKTGNRSALVRLGGVFSANAATDGHLLALTGTITGAPGFDFHGAIFFPTLTRAASGVHNLIAGVAFATPVDGGGVGTATTAATVLIESDPPVGIATNRFALLVDAGIAAFDSNILFRTAATGIENNAGELQLNASAGGGTIAQYIGGALRMTLANTLLSISSAVTLQFGTFTATADTATNGYITINDAAGTPRRIATVA